MGIKQMKVAVMQPYFFPYLGYYQLIAAVDRFVVWDDVQYIQRGWVNRNRILLNGEPTYINLPVEKASQSAYINERNVADLTAAAPKLLGQLHSAYRKAPHYQATKQLVEAVLALPEKNLGRFLYQSLKLVCQYLEISTELVLSSELEKEDSGLSGSERVIALAKANQATMYVNAIGGRELYAAEDFESSGIALRFIAMDEINYSQMQPSFVPYLSMIDVLMFNSKDQIQEMLTKYQLQE